MNENKLLSHHNTLVWSLTRLAELQGVVVDKLAIQESVSLVNNEKAAKHQLKVIAKNMQLPPATVIKTIDPTLTPSLIFSHDKGWGILRGINSQEQWLIEWCSSATGQVEEQLSDNLIGYSLFTLFMKPPFSASKSAVYQQVKSEMFQKKKNILDIFLAGLIINVIGVCIAFYSLQVYDRVIPTSATSTLVVLTIGVLFALVYEYLTKRMRARVFEDIIERVDKRLARSVYMRFLNIRLDNMPKSVGSLSSQMRGYETVRSFLTTVTSQVLVDTPFVFIYIGTIAIIAGKLALVPVLFFLICLLIGMSNLRKVESLTRDSTHSSNQKTGLLVESVEGAETIKSGNAGWRMLTRWMNLADQSRYETTSLRRQTENAQFIVAALQQCSYIALIATGALLVSDNELTMGGLIACSILSGRILGPVATIPGSIVQWGHCKASLIGLEGLWKLESDHFGQKHPVIVDSLKGSYRMENVVFGYNDSQPLSIESLHIEAGEKIAILGAIGSGKTSLLRLFSGMYKPNEGQVFMDDIDLDGISKPIISESVGFLQQDGRLFAGSLRDNLILGMLDPGDQVINEVAQKTGLYGSVIASHPKGLQREIFEGGTGLSIGQRQLVNLTRLMLKQPKVWLLDEPTASMDRGCEARILTTLKQAIKKSDTFVLVTHKMDLLSLVDRIIVLNGNKIVLDGPKAQVLNKLASINNANSKKLKPSEE